MICHYWVFNDGFKFQDSVCNGYHDLTMVSININNIAIITVNNVGYCCIIHSISKSKTINLLKSSVLKDCEYIHIKYCLRFQSIQSRFFCFV